MPGRTWITNMTHFDGVLDPAVDVPAPARKLAAFMGDIVFDATCRPTSQLADTAVACQSPRCTGHVRAKLEGLVAIQWHCSSCDEQGRISEWRGSPWDMTGKPAAERRLPQPSRRPATAPATTAPSDSLNRYCQQLGVPVPRLEEVLSRKRLKMREAMIVALLERGSPMGVDELANRLGAAGFSSTSGDMATSVLKAWRKLAPIVKDGDERFALEVNESIEWLMLLYRLGIKVSPASAPPPDVPTRQPDEPLTFEEVEAAFKDRSPNMGATRIVAAALDPHGGTLPLEELRTYLGNLLYSGFKQEVTDASLRVNRQDLVSLVDGRLILNHASEALAGMRTTVRKIGRPALLAKERSKQIQAAMAVNKSRHERRKREGAAQTASLERAIIRVVPAADHVQSAALLDLQGRSIRTFVGDELGALATTLERYDVLVGLHPRETVGALGLSSERFHRLIDLRPPRKTRGVGGRTVQITPELLISSSTGISQPLGDPEQIARYVADGDRRKLDARLGSDLKSLFAFYRYGVLQRGVRLRWGDLDDGYDVSWELPGETSLFEIVEAAGKTGQTIELVVGDAPGWEDPWSRAERYRAIRVDSRDVVVEGAEGRVRIPRREVQAVRVL